MKIQFLFICAIFLCHVTNGQSVPKSTFNGKVEMKAGAKFTNLANGGNKMLTITSTGELRKNDIPQAIPGPPGPPGIQGLGCLVLCYKLISTNDFHPYVSN